ncbi:LrgB family protein [Luteolibacter pohnpeiensis]|uniref:LrgB family protein n=1 Tax=Luteolibacter pohnpeiensis TaxID=454153 RepID=A0A934VW92_9BACT|nr:LrgB family protein [Luteolibacter pohnpeiensis]MBK1884377.1 LrgB family protein [Luteolibacter pohnpeiensis]
MHALAEAAIWCLVTLAVYAGSRKLHQKFGRWWSSPLLLTWTVCGIAIVATHTTYHEYLEGTHWMVWLLGPATVAFAIPIHRHREMVRRHWLLLAIGVSVGCILAVSSSWLLAWGFGLSPQLRASLLPRSITTPLAMDASSRLGGSPELTAVFTALTGLFGAAIGENLLKILPVTSSLARGALFGMGAHGAGVAKATELGQEEGVIASLIMILAGQLTVIVVALISSL